MKLKDKVAVITGAGSGIGHEIALHFAREGANIGVADVNMDGANKTVEELKARNMTILLAEQNLQFALRMGDYFYIIDNGAIVFAGDKSSLDANKEVQLRYLGVGM